MDCHLGASSQYFFTTSVIKRYTIFANINCKMRSTIFVEWVKAKTTMTKRTVVVNKLKWQAIKRIRREEELSITPPSTLGNARKCNWNRVERRHGSQGRHDCHWLWNASRAVEQKNWKREILQYAYNDKQSMLLYAVGADNNNNNSKNAKRWWK